MFTLGGVAVLLALEAGAETLLTLWSKGDKRAWALAAGIGLYALVGLAFALALRLGGGSLAVVNALWQVANIVVVTLIGVFFMRNKLSHIEWLGILLALAAAVCFVVKPRT